MVWVLVIGWVICGVLSYGMGNYDYATISPNTPEDRKWLRTYALSGPIGVIGILVTLALSNELKTNLGLRFRD